MVGDMISINSEYKTSDQLSQYVGFYEWWRHWCFELTEWYHDFQSARVQAMSATISDRLRDCADGKFNCAIAITSLSRFYDYQFSCVCARSRLPAHCSHSRQPLHSHAKSHESVSWHHCLQNSFSVVSVTGVVVLVEDVVDSVDKHIVCK